MSNRKAWFYNPENDLALADGSERYTPPKGAMAVARSCRLLPMLWADENDEIIVPMREWDDERLHAVAASLIDRYGACGRVVSRVSADSEIVAWGWSAYARRVLTECGADEKQLPDRVSLELMRELSHRRISVKVNESVGEMMRGVQTPPLPIETDSLNEIGRLAGIYESLGYEGVVVKLPWSCSSSGVVMVTSDRLRSLGTQIDGMIRRQGSVMVEAWVKRKSDFAMLFKADAEEGVKFRGVSLFITDTTGRYGGNLVMSQADLQERIGSLPHGLAEALEMSLEGLLSASEGRSYTGWIGVDMMKYDYCGHTGLAPCVEVNLRMTMGVAAYMIADRLSCKRREPAMLLGATPSGIVLDPLR